MEPTHLSPEDLAADLRRLGVRSGEVLMVHASLRRIGLVHQDGDSMLRAIDSVIGPGGTIVMNVGARDDWDWVNDRPADERFTLLARAEPFDCLTTPADPDNGILAELFRTSDRTLVSDHPDGRFAARGPLAAPLLTDVPWHDYYGSGSTLERFVAAKGRVLRLGADPDTVTLLHYAEHLAPLAPKRRVTRHHLVRTIDGPQVRVVHTLDDTDGIVDHPGEDYFAVILREYLHHRRPPAGLVGGAPSELIEGDDLVGFAVGWMTDHLRPGRT